MESIFLKKLQDKIDDLEHQKFRPNLAADELKEINSQLEFYKTMLEKAEKTE